MTDHKDASASQGLREKFEAWLISNKWMSCTRGPSGLYIAPTVEVAWWAWQASRKQMAEEAAAGFAKIVPATDGSQVLFFKDNGEDGPELVQMTEVDGITVRFGLGFEEDDEGYQLRQKAFDKAGVETADQMRAAIRSLATPTEGKT